MKYFEVKDPYYALIPAQSKEEAIQIYVDEIAEDDDNCLENEMVEVTQLYAFTKFADALKDEFKTIGEALDSFLNAHILLIDGHLI